MILSNRQKAQIAKKESVFGAIIVICAKLVNGENAKFANVRIVIKLNNLDRRNKMIKWNELINSNQKAVVKFADGDISGRNFAASFAGSRPNFARQAIRGYGVGQARRLARKALSRQGF